MSPIIQQGISPADVVVYAPGLTGPFKNIWRQQLQKDLQQKLAACDALALLLSRSHKTSISDDGFYHHAYQLITHQDGSKHIDVPAAAHRYQNTLNSKNKETTRSEAWYINCDPVIIQPDRDQAVLMVPDTRQIQEQLSKQMIALINDHFSDEPWRLIYISISQWLIVSQQQYTVTTTSLFDVQYKNIDPLLPGGDNAKYWINVLNEMQMLIHQHNSKLQFENAALGFNSVWLWGAGCVGENQSSWKNMYTDESELTSIGKSLKLTAGGIDEFVVNKDTLVITGELLHALRNRNIEQWLTRVNYMETMVFNKLLAALKNKVISSVNIVTESTVYTVNTKDIKRWWRRKHVTSSFLQWTNDE